MTAEFVDKIETDAAIGKISGRIPTKVVGTSR